VNEEDHAKFHFLFFFIFLYLQLDWFFDTKVENVINVEGPFPSEI